MKKQVIAIFAASLIYLPISCFASYIIELNNGHRFITELWWKEGALIKFYIYGGVVGLDRGTIGKIERSGLEPTPVPEFTRAPELTQAPILSSEPATRKDSGPEQTASRTIENKAAPDPVQLQNFYMEKQGLDQQKKQAYFDFNDAKRAGNNAALEKARARIKQADQQIKDLLEKSKAANSGQTPDWW